MSCRDLLLIVFIIEGKLTVIGNVIDPLRRSDRSRSASGAMPREHADVRSAAARR
jgi:hypothetical protein